MRTRRQRMQIVTDAGGRRVPLTETDRSPLPVSIASICAPGTGGGRKTRRG